MIRMRLNVICVDGWSLLLVGTNLPGVDLGMLGPAVTNVGPPDSDPLMAGGTPVH
jgi:hypothetical protein